MPFSKRQGIGVALALGAVLAAAPVAGAATAEFLSHTTGQPGQYNALSGSFTGSGDTVTVSTAATSGTVLATITPFLDTTTQVAFQLPANLSLSGANQDPVDTVAGDQVAHTVYLSVGGSNALPFDVVTVSFGSPDRKPHGDFSTSTDFCLSCHMVHKGNDGASNQNPYGLLGYEGTATTSWSQNSLSTNPADVVVAVCENCHSAFGQGSYFGSGYTGPNGGFSGSETVASTAHFNVYKNTDQAHPMGAAEPPDSVGVSLAYLHLNTTTYETTGAGTTYQGQAPSGLYCGSCHSPHGDYSANSWVGWDAAQFSQNYGNNIGASAVAGDGLPGSAGGTNYWTTALGSGFGGTIPLTNALLIDNPGHQNGLDNNSANPNVPSGSDVSAKYADGGSSMNFSPFTDPVEVGANSRWTDIVPDSIYVGSVVNPLYGGSGNTGATDDTLSNFCMGCHNLNGGAYSEMQGHPAHPIQGLLSPDSAGIDTIYSTTATAYSSILNGCTSCHGTPLVPGNNGSDTFASGFNYQPATTVTDATYFGSDFASFDFPHTTPSPSYDANDDILLKAPPDGLCLSCHDGKANWSSLP